MRIIILDDLGDINIIDPTNTPEWCEKPFMWQNLYHPCSICGDGILIQNTHELDGDIVCRRCLLK